MREDDRQEKDARRRARWHTLALAALGLASGCMDLRSPQRAAQPLTIAEDQAVLACQRTVTAASAKFVAAATKQLGRCAQLAVALRVEEDRDLNSATLPHFAERRAAVARQCDATFARMGQASRKLIDAVVARCRPAEDLLYTDPTRGDPLGFRTLGRYLEEATDGLVRAGSVSELAALLCGQQADAIAEMMTYQVSRASDASRTILGLGAAGFQDYLLGFLDPRCARPG